MEPQIIISNLAFGYTSPLFEVKRVNLEINAGDIVALIGPSGIGKSTLLASLFTPSFRIEGEVTISNEKSPKKNPAIGFVPQDATEESKLLSVLDIVSFGTGNIGAVASRKAQHDAMQILMELNIAQLSNRRMPELSGGQQQRVMLARAVLAASESKILCLDEPTANLDEDNQKVIYTLLKKLSKEGYIIVISTHELDFALKEASTVVALSKNRIDIIEHSELESSGFLDSLFLEGI